MRLQNSLTRIRLNSLWVAFGAALAALAVPSTAAQVARDIVWFPEHRLQRALVADPLEPMLGTTKAIGSNRIEARVGVLRDIVQAQTPALPTVERAAIGLSGNAVMLLRLRQFGTKSPATFPFFFRRQVDFPLETGDYSFGGYLALRHRPVAGRVAIGSRLHIVHVSSHLGDGRYDTTSNMWRGREPVDYSRNYAQLVLDADDGPTGLRLYAAPALLTWAAPVAGEPVARAFVQGGAEWRGKPLGSSGVRPFAAADVRTFPRLQGTRARTGSSLVAGLRVGAWNERAVDVRVTRLAGASWRGQFYGLRESTWGVGLRIGHDD